MSIYKAIRHGWHSGKGNKNLRNENYKKALEQYDIALRYSENEGGRAAILECAAKALIHLGRYDKAMSYLHESLSYYKKFEGKNELFRSSAIRVTNLLKELEGFK